MTTKGKTTKKVQPAEAKRKIKTGGQRPKAPTHAQFRAALIQIGACPPAVRWVERNGHTLLAAWRACPDASWMAWFLEELVERAVSDLNSGRLRRLLDYDGMLAYVVRQAMRWGALQPGNKAQRAGHAAALLAKMRGMIKERDLVALYLEAIR